MKTEIWLTPTQMIKKHTRTCYVLKINSSNMNEIFLILVNLRKVFNNKNVEKWITFAEDSIPAFLTVNYSSHIV